MKLKSIVLVCLLVSCIPSDASLINNFIDSAKSFWASGSDLSVDHEIKKLPDVSFELPIENEEFLKEGLALIDAPREGLDLCSHRVVAALKKTCNKLGAEEMSKLAVMMLNCQLEIEGRPTFTCKPEMTLQQCTMGMDANMHKIYSYMSHRAAGICSALKSDQFRALTEVTVNRLMQATQSQLSNMQEALTNQRRLSEMELQNMKDYNENDLKIRESQAESLEKLKHAGSLIEENLLSLQQELELRQKSEVKLNEIEKSADEISSKLNQHTTELNEGHDKLLKDVDEISQNLQKSNLELVQQYNQTLEFLQNFKSVMMVLSTMATNIKNLAEKILTTLHDVGFEMTDEFIAFMFLNLIYFTCGMIFMLFVNAVGYCKNILIILFVFNTASSYYKAQIPLFPINIFIWFSYLALLLLRIFKKRLSTVKFAIPNLLKFQRKPQVVQLEESDSDDDYRERSVTPLRIAANQKQLGALFGPPQARSKAPVSEPPTPLSSSQQPAKIQTRRLTTYADNEIESIFKSQPSLPSSTSLAPADPPAIYQRPMSPNIRRLMSDAYPPVIERSGTPFMLGMPGRIQCQGITAKGLQCKNAAIAGVQKCRLHNN